MLQTYKQIDGNLIVEAIPFTGVGFNKTEIIDKIDKIYQKKGYGAKVFITEDTLTAQTTGLHDVFRMDVSIQTAPNTEWFNIFTIHMQCGDYILFIDDVVLSMTAEAFNKMYSRIKDPLDSFRYQVRENASPIYARYFDGTVTSHKLMNQFISTIIMKLNQELDIRLSANCGTTDDGLHYLAKFRIDNEELEIVVNSGDYLCYIPNNNKTTLFTVKEAVFNGIWVYNGEV